MFIEGKLSPRSFPAKLLVAVAVVIGGILVLTQLPREYVDYLLIGAGITVGLVVIYQLVQMIREYTFDYVSFPASPVEEAPAPGSRMAREDSLILEWARDCLKAGRSLEAGTKLERISPNLRSHPDVLKLRYEIYRQERRWHAALDAVQAYCNAVPEDAKGWIGQAFCLHKMKLSQRALNTLLRVVDKFPRNEFIAYYIALFTTELGRLEQAKRWLFRALASGDKKKIVAMAMDEPDLGPLLHFLGRKAMVEKVVSGGLSGAERAALDFAKVHGIPHGGWCSKARAGEDGFIQRQYNLKETDSSGYALRTEWNVRGSDGTVIFSLGEELSGACAKVEEFAARFNKPCVHIRRDQAAAIQANRLLDFIERNQLVVLNIAGSSSSREPQVGEFVNETLERAFQARLRSILEDAGREEEE